MWKVISKDPFILKCCLDRYKTQETCDKAVYFYLSTLKFIPIWFVTSTMIKKLDDDLFSNYEIIFVNQDSNYATFFSDEVGILSVDLNNFNLDDVNFDEDDPDPNTF